MNDQIIGEFARKWGVPREQVTTIYILIEQCAGKYGKSHRILASFGLKISSRQLRYFYRKCRLYRQLDILGKGKPKNYSELLRNRT